MNRSDCWTARITLTLLLAAAAACTAPVRPARAATTPPIRLSVDATEAPRRILHARLEIPVRPGDLTLYYPKWIPGEHGPTGPLVDLAGLRLVAGGRPITWERDAVDMFALHCRVPAGATTLEVALDFLLAGGGRHSAGSSATARLLVLNWNQVVLYPAGRRVDAIPVAARLRLPRGWAYGTALTATKETPDSVEFAPVSLATLVDSPVLAGAHLRHIELSSRPEPPAVLHIACDGAAGLAASPALVAQWRQLVAEAGALFGARHYRRYDFLLALSDHVERFGLEHHESSDNRLQERALVDGELRLASAGLLPHEFAHSWNGKYRRPAQLMAPDFQAPNRTGMLWVYEGLTSYLDLVLTARSGLLPPERSREDLAYTAGGLDRRPGRTWRPLQDTAVEAQVLFGSPEEWRSWRRGVDFYGEGVLVWLEADVLIRQKTGGRRSLDDFCRLFFGGPSGPPAVVPYGFEDLVKALDQVAPYDWRGFFAARLESMAPHPPLGGIEGSGWRVVWSDTMSAMIRAEEKSDESTDLRFSIGIVLDKDGAIADVVPGSVAAEAGLGPGMKPVAVNGRRFSVEWLRQTLREGRNGTEPVELIVEDGEFVRSFRLDWHGGELYPALARDPSKPDLLTEILKPLTPRIAVEESGE
jgi:predicted metalloprotease with PDZ domain